MATEQTEPRRGPGRPRTRPVEARRNVTFRANDLTYEQLTAAAKANGRSMSEEIERRIEQSFREPDLVKKAVLEVSFGSKKVAKVMEMIGVLARVAEARTGQTPDESLVTLELVVRSAERFLKQQSAMSEEQRNGLNFNLDECASEVAGLTHRIYHDRDRERVKADAAVLEDAAGSG